MYRKSYVMKNISYFICTCFSSSVSSVSLDLLTLDHREIMFNESSYWCSIFFEVFTVKSKSIDCVTYYETFCTNWNKSNLKANKIRSHEFKNFWWIRKFMLNGNVFFQMAEIKNQLMNIPTVSSKLSRYSLQRELLSCQV